MKQFKDIEKYKSACSDLYFYKMSDKDVLQDREPASDEAVKLDDSREKSVMRMKLWRCKEGVYLLVDSDKSP